MIKMTNRWIQKIKKLEKKDIDEYGDDYYLYSKLIDEIKKINNAVTIKDVEKIYKRLEKKIGEKVNYIFWRFVQNQNEYHTFDDALNTYSHISSKYLDAKQDEDMVKVEYRLYINCANENVIKLIDEYITVTEKRNIPFLIKFTANPIRNEKFIVYSETKYLKENIEILREIGHKYPSIIRNSGPVSIITGNIDNWIGLASEPENKNIEQKSSFHAQRAQILEDAAEKTITNYIKKNLDKRITYLGQSISVYDLLLVKASEVIMGEIISSDKHYYLHSSIYNIDYQRMIINELIKNDEYLLLKGINKLESISDNKNLTIFENRNTIFEIELPDGKSHSFSIETADKIIKSFVNVLEETEPKLVDLYRAEIKRLCKKNHVDENNFSLNSDSLIKFRQLDRDEIREKKTVKKPDEKKLLYGEACSIIFDIIVSSDNNLEVEKVRPLIKRVKEIINIFEEKYKDKDTAKSLTKNLKMAETTYESKTNNKLSAPKHLAKISNEGQDLEEYIKNMESLTDEQKEILLETLEENRLEKERNSKPKHL